ncbi:MAG: radical SAM protein [Deltaproteobacteria bacterium]|nr:radical SAM protein [Deltaproteobacteria bacterium]
MRDAGAKIQLCDALLAGGEPRIRKLSGGWQMGLAPEDLVPGLGGSPDAVVVGCSMFQHPGQLTGSLSRLFELLAARFPEAKLVLADCYVGGIDYFPYEPKRVLLACPELDAIVLGEAESILPELIKRLLGGKSPSGLERVAWRRGRKKEPVCGVIPGKRRISFKRLALPAFDLLDMDAFFRLQKMAVNLDLIHEFHRAERILPWMASRGCPFGCSFCAGQYFDHQQRRMPVRLVLEQLEKVVANTGAERVFFMDDCLNASASWFEELSAGLAVRKIAWEAPNGLRARGLSTKAVRNMVRAGVRRPSLSAESGDEDVLRHLVGKGQGVDDIKQATGRLARAGLPPKVHFIIGFPGETRAQMQRTLSLAADLAEVHGAQPRLQVATPVPGTPLHRDAKRQEALLKDPQRMSPVSLFFGPGLIRTQEFEPKDLMRFKAALARRLESSNPATLVLAPGYACNNHCVFCCVSDRIQRPRSMADLNWALKRGRTLGLGKLDIDGGEPTLFAKLPELIRRARDIGYERVTLVSNGRMFIYDRLAQQLAAAGLDEAVISLHGATANSHDALVGVAGAFEQTRQGVANLLAAGLSVQGTSLLLEANQEELPDIATCWQTWGVSGLSWLWPLPEGRAQKLEIAPKVNVLGGKLEQASQSLTFRAQLHHLPLCMLSPRPKSLLPAPIKTSTRMLGASRRLLSLGRKIQRHFGYHDACSRCSERVACAGVPLDLLRQGLVPDKDFIG